MPDDTMSRSAALWAQSFQTWTEAWAALAAPNRGDDQPAADPFGLWRQSFDQWLAGWTAQTEQTLQTPEAAVAGGRLLDQILNIERPLRERATTTMQFWLEFCNMPTRADLLRLATNINDANARLDELQVQVEAIADQITELAGRVPVARSLITTTGGAQ